MWIVVTSVVIVTTIGFVNVWRSPKTYRASAKILVESKTPQVVKIEGVMNDSGWWDPEYYRTQQELLLSRVVMEKALENPVIKKAFIPKPGQPTVAPKTSFISDIKRSLIAMLGAAPVAPAEPWERLRGRLTSQHMEETHFILLKADGTDPVLIATIVNVVAESFQSYHLEKKREAYEDAYSLLLEEKKKEEANLIKAEKALEDFHRTSSIVTTTSSGEKQPAIENLERINKQRTDIQLRRIELMSQYAVVKEALSADKEDPLKNYKRLSSIPSIRDDPTISNLSKHISDLQKTLHSLTRVYGPEHPKFKAAEAEIEVARQQYIKALNDIVLSMVSQLKTIQHQEEDLSNQYEKQNAIALDLSKEMFQFTRLDGEVKRHKKLFDTLVDRIRELDVSSGFVKMNVRLVEKAGVPRVPVSPRARRALMTSLFMGLFLGIGLAFFVDHLDDGIKTPEDLKESLNVPMLGFVPEMKKTKDINSRMERGMMSLTEPTSSVAEAYRNIRTSILYSRNKDKNKILAITSCGPGEGKTSTSTNLALTMASSGKNVLLIDGDFHRPMIAKVLNLKESRGMTDVLSGKMEFEKCIQHVIIKDIEVEHLDVLTVGPESTNPADLLGSKFMIKFLEDVREKYDWVIIDTPPALFVSDASILSALCDGIIFVVKAGKCNHSMLTRTRNHLDGLNVHIIGSVLNGMIAARFGRYASDHYYYGYSKYATDYHKSYYSRDKK